jgi:hypothetical protein
MNTPRDFCIYLSTGKILTVQAPSLRKALATAEKQCGNAEIVAALGAECLPPPSSEALPFHAVLLRNPSYTPPPEA